MRQTVLRFVLALWMAVVVYGPGSNADANKLDLALARFIECNDDGSKCRAHNQDFEEFIMAYAYGLSPRLMAPAETLGYSGFYMGIEGTLTPWLGSKDLWKTGTAPDGYPKVMFMPAVHVRKGLPWSFEIGGSINYLAQSELVALGGEVKWSLFEGYRHGFRGGLPDFAVRGTVNRVLGQTDIDMTIVGVDGSISYPFGIGGMVTLTPYGGFQYLFTIINVEPLVYYDEANEKFQNSSGGLWTTSNLSQPRLQRAKVFGGFRFGYEMLSITFEMDWGIRKTWDLDVEDQSHWDIDNKKPWPADKKTTSPGETTTKIRDQIRISAGVGLDF